MNRIKIDPERILSDIDRNIFGGYMELGIKTPDLNILISVILPTLTILFWAIDSNSSFNPQNR